MKTVLNIVMLIFMANLISCQQILRENIGTESEAKEIISKHKITFNEPPGRIPAPHSVDAPLLGNGFTGIAISGDPEHQVYHMARNDFWRLKSSFNQCFPAVLGRIEIDIPDLKDASYNIEQEIYTATTTSTFSQVDFQVEFKTYVSATEDIMVLQIDLEGKKELSGSLRLSFPGENELINNPPFDVIFDDVQEAGDNSQGTYWMSRAFAKDVDIVTKSACAFRILDHPSNEFKLISGRTVTAVFAFSSNFKKGDCLSAVIEKIKSISFNDIPELENQHKKWWAKFWSQSYVDIPDKVIEKQYYLSQYALASCSRDPDFPPSIFGSWITKERPHWNGDYHLNYNHMAPYYGLYSSNHIEQASSQNAPILAAMDRGLYYAKKITGIANGVMLPVGIGPLSMESTRRNELMEVHRQNWIEQGSVEDKGLFYGQKSNSAYCVVNMSMQFYHTYDKTYTQKVYPFVKGVATFWEEYLKYEDGRYVIYNDAIHEGTVGTMNPILSLGLVPMVMQTAIDMSKELKRDVDRHSKWQHIIEKISDYSYQEKEGKKVFRYSEKGTDWWGDNTLGIQHIYPAGRIGLESDSQLLKIAKNTIEVMSRWSDFNGTNSFFPAAVRVGYNPDTILHYLKNYALNTYPNGFQLNNPHGIENFSTVPNTINEMLCMGHQGVVRIFPVWPKRLDVRFENIRVEGAFLVSGELKNGQVLDIHIISEKGRILALENPWPKSEILVQQNEKIQKMRGQRIRIDTESGDHLTINLVK